MKTYKFTARLEKGGGDGVCIFFPHDVEKEFGTRGRVPVRAKFDGEPYTGSMIKYGFPQHMLPILKAIREKIGKAEGDTIQVEVTRDETERKVDVPPEFSTLLKRERLLAGFEKLSFTHQKEYVRWITEAKREETRQRRVAKAVEMLRDGIKTPG